MLVVAKLNGGGGRARNLSRNELHTRATFVLGYGARPEAREGKER